MDVSPLCQAALTRPLAILRRPAGRWRRLGRLVASEGQKPWMVSHASVPFAEALPDGLHRIWFTPRDAAGRSHVAWVVVDLERPQQILDLASAPALGPGPLGQFDDGGAMMSWLLEWQGHRLLYYVGWSLRGSVPYHVAIGLAQAGQTALWQRHPGPVLERGPDDPWFCSNPCILPDATGEGLRAWYLGGLGWEETPRGLSPSYHVCHARSADGMRWTERGCVVLPLEGDDFAIARPCVVRGAEGYAMWYCVRTRERAYRLGAAVSADGLRWERRPELAELLPAETGWDSEMIAYPHVFDHAGARWMLYCGNGFGRSGFGLAVWE